MKNLVLVAFAAALLSVIYPEIALPGQTDQVTSLARQIEEDFASALESIEIGGLSPELGHMLLQRSQSLPDPRLIDRDNKELLVPNKEFITGRLLNWSLSDQSIRVVVVVEVAYGTDVDKALELMKRVADENEHVLEEPAPVVSFEGFGDNALTLLLRAPISSVDRRVATITELHKAVNRKFADAGISIAFPQRDLHLNTKGPLRVTIVPNAPGPLAAT